MWAPQYSNREAGRMILFSYAGVIPPAIILVNGSTEGNCFVFQLFAEALVIYYFILWNMPIRHFNYSFHCITSPCLWKDVILLLARQRRKNYSHFSSRFKLERLAFCRAFCPHLPSSDRQQNSRQKNSNWPLFLLEPGSINGLVHPQSCRL